MDGLRVLVDVASMAAVDAATIDFRDDPLQPGFVVQPRRVEVAITDSFDPSSPLAAQVESVLVHHVNPAIAGHGGLAQLVGVKDDVVFVALGGGCQGSSMASVTLKQGIEQILKQAIPRIRAVVDATDHALGSNPFYTSEKAPRAPSTSPPRRSSSHDREPQQAVCATQAGFHLGGRVTVGEDETQVAAGSRQRLDVLAARNADGDLVDATDGLRVRQSMRLTQDARVRNRNHHHARWALLTLYRREVQAGRLAQDDLFERRTVAKPERARAQPSDRPRGDFDDPRAALVQSELDMDRPSAQA